MKATIRVMLTMVPVLALGVSVPAPLAEAAEAPPIDWKTYLEELGPNDSETEEDMC